MSARQGESGVSPEVVRAARPADAAPVPSLLAEPGILLRMLAPALDDERPAAAPAAAVAGPVPLARFAVLVVAVVWFVLDAAATLGRGGSAGLDLALPGVFAAAVGGAGLGLALTAAPRWLAVVDLVAVVVLLAGAAVGAAGQHGSRIGLQAAVVALWCAQRLPGRAVRGRDLGFALLVAVGAAAATAAVRSPLLAAIGPAGSQALSLALTLLLPVLLWRLDARPSAPRRWAVATAVGGAVLLWWAAPAALALDTANGARVLFAVALGAVLVPVAAARRLVPLLVAGLAGACAAWCAAAAPGDVAAATVLRTRGAAVASYERATQTLQLAIDGVVVARAGPDHRCDEFVSTLVQTFAQPGDRTLVLGVGTGRLPDLLLRSGRHEVEVVDADGDGERFAAVLRGDGPVVAPAAAADARVRRTVQAFGAALAALPAGSRQTIVLATAPGSASALPLSVEFQCELRRVAGDGLVVQPFLCDATPVGRVQALLGAAAVAHAWNAVFAVGDDAWLVSAARPLAWPADAALQDWPEHARWIAHAAHIGGVLDLRRTLLGIVLGSAAGAAVHATEPPTADGASGRRTVLAVLHEVLRPEPLAEVVDPHSVLLRWLGRRLDAQLAAAELARLGDRDDDRQRAQAIAVRFLPTGAPSAPLQAALGLAGEHGGPLVEPSLAARRAHAIDPTFFRDCPPVLRALPRPRAPAGDLEDLAQVPPPARLAALCVGDTPMAAALRARFPSPCARALVELLAVRPLAFAETEALRELADPFVLAAASRGLLARGAVAELVSLWRRDLPMPPALSQLLAAGDVLVQARFVPALAGRTDAASLAALADGLVSPAIDVRRAAAAALRVTAGDTIGYDPEGPRSALNEAADRVRSLHNRAP